MAKQEESKIQKLKHFFGIGGKGGSVNLNNVKPQQKEFVVNADIIAEICPSSPHNSRMRNINLLSEIVHVKKLEENAVEAIWKNMEDLLQPSVSKESRQIVFNFLSCLIKGQYNNLGIMRAHFFQVIKNHECFEDLPQRLDLFIVLTKNGKDLEYFEEEAGPFLLVWMKEIMSSSKVSEFLDLLKTFVRYNAAYLHDIDEDIIGGIVLNTCMIANQTPSDDVIDLCLGVLDTIVCYIYLPSNSLQYFVVCMCRTVYKEKFSQGSWDLMKKLLGTHLGHSCIHTMCCMLQDKNNITDSGALVLRGAVFFIGMALWGSKRVPSLKHPPSAVLPSFQQALQHSNSGIVAFEVVVSLNRLVNKYGKEQQMVTWDIILNIIRTILRYIETATSPTKRLVTDLHDLLSSIEDLCRRKQFNGSEEAFFSIIETCAAMRPESSILLLVTHKAQTIEPSTAGWMEQLYHLVEKYLKFEGRPKIRLQILTVLSDNVNKYLQTHEEELMDIVVLPLLGNIDADKDVEVRTKATKILVELAHNCQTSRWSDLMDIIRKIVNKPGSFFASMSPASFTDTSASRKMFESQLTDVQTAIHGLVGLFETKLFRHPSHHSLKVYEMFVNHIKQHYKNESAKFWAGSIRKQILECFLNLRADSLYRLGLPNKVKGERLAYSSFALCMYRVGVSEKSYDVGTASPKSSQSPVYSQIKHTILPYADAFECIRICLEEETDWTVLKVVLDHMPLVLQNKTIVLSAKKDDVERFCSRLCLMVSNRTLQFPENLINKPAKFTKSDFHGDIFPVLACLASYHTLLDRNRQTELVRCLEFGLVSKCAKICIHALTLCTLEMHDVMMRQLPSVLLKLSQISATVAMAVPLMEFLSSLIRLPQLYTNFVEDQYMSIFAIALPYTNPFKYSHYTVSMAYHVIAMWFIKCKLTIRKRFIGFIVKGLKANVLRQFEETANMRTKQNQDSSDRDRTHSLNEEPKKKSVLAAAKAAAEKNRLSGPPSNTDQLAFLQDESMVNFHKELTETCIDMMARYTFFTCSSMPKRSEVANFLLQEGQHQSWLLGNTLVTISTSGGAKVGKTGLCHRCLTLARNASKVVESASSTEAKSSGRKRHRSAAVRSQSETVSLKPLSQDDIHLHRQGSREEKSDTDLLAQRSQDSLDSASEDVLSPLNEVVKPGETRKRSVTFSSKTEKMEYFDSVLMGLNPKSTEQSIFSSNSCNCWCTLWAEIHIRRPTGNISWMMRIQNEQDLADTFQDFPLADISNLFISSADMNFDYMSRKKIDSTSLAESEYESLHEEHFYPDSSEASDVTSHTEKSESPSVEVDLTEDTISQNSKHEDELDEAVEKHKHELGPGRESPIRKSCSSPDLTPTQQEKLFLGEGECQLQNAYTRSKEIIKQASIDSNSEKEPDNTQVKEKVQTKEREPVKGKETEANEESVLEKEPIKSEPLHINGRPHSQTLVQGDRRSQILNEANIESAFRPRGNTVSTTEYSRVRSNLDHKKFSNQDDLTQESPKDSQQFPKDSNHGGINPSFVFLQLYHANIFGTGEARPLALPQHQTAIERSVKMLDLLYPYETHKIGVLFVREGQEKEADILGNIYGSSRYADFLRGLGHLLRLKDCQQDSIYIGGLDENGDDGEFAYFWLDDFMQVVYHVATLMPNKEKDPNCTQKKRHIGNDYVTIVYNESGKDWKIGTIKGQFNYVNIVIQPLDHNSNAVKVQTKDDIADVIGHTDTKIVSDTYLALLVRQMAVHANLASLILQRQRTNPRDPYASNWLERLRQIKRIRNKVCQENQKDKQGTPIPEDFTDFV